MEYRYVRPFAGEPIPKDLSGWDGLIAMGGSMSANDGERLGFIADELRLLTKMLEAGMPALGICLGAQLIAKAAGAEVTAGEEKEIGWYPLTLTEEGEKDRHPPRRGLPGRLGKVFQPGVPSGREGVRVAVPPGNHATDDHRVARSVPGRACEVRRDGARAGRGDGENRLAQVGG